MTRSSCWLLGTSALAWFAALCACSGKGAPSGQGQTGGSVSACLGQAIGQTTSGACYACMQASCASQLGAFGSDCSDYLACVCPDGAYDVSAQSSQTCQAKLTSDSACVPSAQAVNTCAEQSCASACHPSTGSGGSSGGGGVAGAGGSGGGSGGGSTVVMACGVTFSVASCAQCVTAQCCSVTQTCGEDQACVGIISCLHQCGQNTSCEQNCVSSAPASAQQELNAAAQCWSSSCSSGC